MIIRDFDLEKDKQASYRVWREVGWGLEGEKQEHGLDLFAGASAAMVAEVEGSAECVVFSHPGTVRYLGEELTMTAITGVTTSYIVRKQGLAGRVTSRVIAQGAARGAMLSGLGMFDQGFYNRLGFGTGSYAFVRTFDPAQLAVDGPVRMPRRLGSDDWAAIHTARLARQRQHGSVCLLPPEITQAELLWSKGGFGLGYADGPDGALSHFLWCENRGGEHGPFAVTAYAFQNRDQFLDLMRLLKSLGDQVHAVRFSEPPGVQLQDLLRQPFKQERITRRTDFAASPNTGAWWQMRICDLPGCLARTHLPGETVRFNLTLADPITRFLDDDAPWRGVGGEYVVTLGPESSAERGQAAGLPDLNTTVNAFTRLWLGVQPATGLAYTDELDASPELLERLDGVLRLPHPQTDWDF